jgi:FkbM family methyltransferase
MDDVKNRIKYSLLRVIGHTDWLRFGLRYRVISYFCHADSVQSTPFEVDFFGYQYQGNLNCYIDWNVYFFGAYEKYELFLLKSLLQDTQKPIFLDIGANIGHHSLFLSQFSHQVHAFEPYGLVRNQLEQKIKTNLIKNIQVHPVGLGLEDAELDFYAPKGSNTGTGSFLASHDAENNVLFGKLVIKAADQYIAQLSLNKIDVIKMDVEGFEKNVLKGMQGTFEKYRPILFMEYSAETHQSFVNEAELMGLLPSNYLVRRVQVDRPLLYFFNQSQHYFDAFDFNSPGGNIIFIPAEQADMLAV